MQKELLWNDEDLELDPGAIRNESYGTFGEQYDGYNFFSKEAFDDSERLEDLENKKIIEYQNSIMTSSNRDSEVKYSESIYFSSPFNLSMKENPEIIKSSSFAGYFILVVVIGISLIVLIKRMKKRRVQFDHQIEVLEKRDEL